MFGRNRNNGQADANKDFVEALGKIQLPSVINGVTMTGIAAMSEDISDPAKSLPMIPDVAGFLANLPEIPNLAKEWKKIYGLGSLFVLFRKLMYHKGIPDANVRFGNFVDNRNFMEHRPQDFLNATMEEWSVAAAVALGTKVNFWAMNHHTGTSMESAEGYVAKILDFAQNKLRLPPVTPQVVTMTWVLGHFISTRSCLRSWGIINIDDCPEAAYFPAAGKDIAIRLQSGPAGTAKMMACRAILSVGMSTMLGSALPYTPGMLALSKAPSSILDARYHVGSQYLTGRIMLEHPSAPSDEIIQILAAFIHAASPKSTLADAKCLPTRQNVSSHDVYLRTQNIRKQMARHAASAAFAAKLGAALERSLDPTMVAIMQGNLQGASASEEEIKAANARMADAERARMAALDAFAAQSADAAAIDIEDGQVGDDNDA